MTQSVWRPNAVVATAPVPKHSQLAAIADLDQWRAAAATRQISTMSAGCGSPCGDISRVGSAEMDSRRIRRILDGVEAAPPEFDSSTVEAFRSLASKLRALEQLVRWW